MALADFLEYADSRAAALTVEADKGIVRGVKVLGPKSANGRTYTEAAMRGALGMYEGVRVNVDHRQPGSKGDRSYGDRFGQLKNVRLGEGGVYGDLHFNPKHKLAEQFAWDAANAPENVGLSHDVTARTSGSGDKVVVEAITAVRSVDLVADPATNKSLYESQRPEVKAMDLVTLKESHADLVAKLREEFLTETRNGEAAKAQAAELKTLREQLDAYRVKEAAALRKAAVEKAIADAKLPAVFVSGDFRDLCESAADDATLAKLIADRKALAESVKVNGPNWTKPTSKPADSELTEARALGPKAFAASLRA